MSAPTPANVSMEQTRSAVLNVLVAVGTGIAVSGWLLRWRDHWAFFPASETLRQGMMAGLVGVAVASFVVRRVLTGRQALRDPERRGSRFYRGHVLAALVAALAVPLGLAYGWVVRPELKAVGPFWVAALALGFFALPRAYELENFDDGDQPEAPLADESSS